jgi:UDP-glucose 4-epimerase
MIKWFGKQKGLSYVILRYFNVCGASDDGLIGDSKKPSSLLVQNAVRGALGIEKFYLTCPRVDTADGTPVRDYINVVDLNEAHYLALKYLLKGGRSETINLGTGKGNSVLEVVNKVQDLTGAKFTVGKSKPRDGEYAKMIADTNKARKVLGWEHKRDIADSVKSLIKWYNLHPNGWDK